MTKMTTTGRIGLLMLALTLLIAPVKAENSLDNFLPSGWTAEEFRQRLEAGDASAIEIARRTNMGMGCGRRDHSERSPGGVATAACVSLGRCDDPYIRDSYQWEPGMPLTYIRLYWHITANSDGSNQACTIQDVHDRMAETNAHFLPLGIQFIYDVAVDSNTLYRGAVAGSDPEGSGYWAMRNDLAVDPDYQLNVYVASGASLGTFPNDTLALMELGGIAIWDDHMHTYSWYFALSHEIGHNLGLYHTFNGYETIHAGPFCAWQCRENVSTGPLDRGGDFCSDTPPEAITYSCNTVNLLDECSNAMFPPFVADNFMSYTNCKTAWTPQQVGRMHCAIDDFYRGYVAVNPGITFDTTWGSDSLTVQFGAYHHPYDTALSWSWEFGDGGTANTLSPSHTYASPGTYDVLASMELNSDTFGTQRNDVIMIEADTVRLVDASGSGEAGITVDVSVHNFVPVEELRIPLSWAGALDLQLDSITNTGLRSQHMSLIEVQGLDAVAGQGTLRLAATPDLALVPGEGPVATLWFSVTDNEAPIGSTNPITIIPYGSQELRFMSPMASYEPDAIDGLVTLTSCCVGLSGNVDGDADEVVDVGDLTALIGFLFLGGADPACLDEANVDGAGETDVGDLTALIQFLFLGGLAPSACPG